MNEFLREASTEGETLRDLVDYYAAEGGTELDAVGQMFRAGGHRRVVFAGMGSSYCAPFAVVDHLVTAGIPAFAGTAFALAHDKAAFVDADTLLIMISKSGTTKELLELVRHGGGTGTVALVNQPDSPLANLCATSLPMRVGAETQIASKSFVCTLAVLNLLAAELTGVPRQSVLDNLHSIAQWACAYLSGDIPILATLAGCDHVDLLACGASFSTAYKSALVLREVPRVMAAAIDMADYAHGWAKAIRSGYVAILFAPEFVETSIEARALGQVLDRGGKAVVITASTVSPQEGLTVFRHPPLPVCLAPLAQAVICDAMIGTMVAA